MAYEVTGTGPPIVCVPGMGDLRSSYRLVYSEVAAAGYRVARTDPRGHGDSDATFGEYGDAATAGDIAALISELGGPAVIVGNSMAAGSAVLVAAEHPELGGRAEHAASFEGTRRLTAKLGTCGACDDG